MENGLALREAVCGIFVLQVEGCDIARNRIFDNGVTGPNVPVDVAGNNTPKIGHRGGIVIGFALAPLVQIQLDPIAGFDNLPTSAPDQTGEPAAKIHDNLVSAPLGQALHLNALGPVTVEDNHLVSRGVVDGFSGAVSNQSAGAVWLLNFGFSNEYYLGYFLFALLAKTDVKFQPGLDRFAIGRSLATGPVLFNGNHVKPGNVLAAGSTFALSSILAITADDLGFQDNDCEAGLLSDFIMTQAVLVGFTLRTNSNRFTEGMLNAIFSAVTIGAVANTTALNEATHCILSLGNRLRRALNTEIVGVNPLLGGNDLTCDSIQRAFSGADDFSNNNPNFIINPNG